MIIWAINLLVLATGILIVGLIKPKWLLFWMQQPSRLIIAGIAMILFMVAAIMFGEGSKQGISLSEVAQTKKPVTTKNLAE